MDCRIKSRNDGGMSVTFLLTLVSASVTNKNGAYPAVDGKPIGIGSDSTGGARSITETDYPEIVLTLLSGSLRELAKAKVRQPIQRHTNLTSPDQVREKPILAWFWRGFVASLRRLQWGRGERLRGNAK
jgi:hypothetical protein